MNQFELMIYKWNLNDAIKYYKNDSFCDHFCIWKNWKYGCKNKNKCPFGSHSINVHDLIWPGNNKSKDFKTGKLLCLYLMYQNVYNDKNPMLFNCYAVVLEKGEEEYIKSEKYYLKALSLDNYNEMANIHGNYALLLREKLKNYDKAEYHYKQGLKIDSNDAIQNINFGSFLMEVQKKYDEGLTYCEKACGLEPNNSYSHFWKGYVLFYLNRFDESIDEYLLSLKLNATDHRMSDHTVNYAKRRIELCVKKHIETKLKQKWYFKKEEEKEHSVFFFMEWLYNNELLSIKDKIFFHEISLNVLKQCRKDDIEMLIKEMQLTTVQRVKFRNACAKMAEEKVDETEEANASVNDVGQINEFKIGARDFSDF